MDLEALEKGMATNKRFDMAKNVININDIICVAEGSYGGSCWLNRGIVIDKSGKSIQYVDIDTEEMRKVLDCEHKALVITKNYSSIERSSFEEIANKVKIKYEEKRIKSINNYFAFAIRNTKETTIISVKVNGNINKNVYTKILNELNNKFKNNELFVWTKNKEFISINDVKYTKVRYMRNSIIGDKISNIIIDNTTNEIIKMCDENGKEYNSYAKYYFSYEIIKYFEEKNITF